MTDVAVGAWNVPLNGYHRAMEIPADLWQRQRVRYAVIAIQRELITLGYLVADPTKLDGGFGPKTDAAAKQYQTDQGLKSDGWVGRKTARRLWSIRYEQHEKDLRIPDHILWGQGGLESAYDPGAEGPNPLGFGYFDRGLQQWNRHWHPEISDADAFGNPDRAIGYAGQFLVSAYQKYGTWDAAILAHNSPDAASRLARGEPIELNFTEYIRLVRAAAAVAP